MNSGRAAIYVGSGSAILTRLVTRRVLFCLRRAEAYVGTNCCRAAMAPGNMTLRCGISVLSICYVAIAWIDGTQGCYPRPRSWPDTVSV
jgi:hypothetical protein